MRYPLPADGEVAVSNVQGSIEVEGWDRAEVEVTVVKTAGEAGSPDDAVISVERNARGLRDSLAASVAGSSRSPKAMAFAGQASAHAVV